MLFLGKGGRGTGVRGEGKNEFFADKANESGMLIIQIH